MTALTTWSANIQNPVPSGMDGLPYKLYLEGTKDDGDFSTPLTHGRHWELQRSSAGSAMFYPLVDYIDGERRILIQGWRFPATTVTFGSNVDPNPDWLVSKAVESILKGMPAKKDLLRDIQFDLQKQEAAAEGDRTARHDILWIPDY